ncbi:MAG: YggT family protein [Clostridiales bacterium]|jgi:uncharacterized protein YggT (Ycf19 family)|nr:YggT family protein [Clostridiales bacterium]
MRLLLPLVAAIAYAGRLMNLLILVRCLMSWVRVRESNAFTRFVFMSTEFIVAPCRVLLDWILVKAFGMRGFMIDFSPMFAMLLIQFVTGALQWLVLTVAAVMMNG